MKEELQYYFDKSNFNSTIENMLSVRNQFTNVFELGGILPNGSKERVEKAFQNAQQVFLETFKDQQSEIIILIYEFPEPNAFNAPNDYLHRQFNNIIDEEILHRDSDKIFIYKLKLKDINWQNILKAIVNTEMGFEPAIDQVVCFFDIKNNLAFQIDDDRYCLNNCL